jgi:hypothetical protein
MKILVATYAAEHDVADFDCYRIDWRYSTELTGFDPSLIE